MIWRLAALVVAAGGALGVADGLRDLAAAPGFTGVLRVVVEVVAVVVVAGWLWRRSAA